MLKLKCSGLLLSALNLLQYAEGSINVPVQIEFDDTYDGYTKVLHIGFYDSRGNEHSLSADQQNDGLFLISSIAFAQAGSIFISVHLSKEGVATEPETNAVYYQVAKTAGGFTSLPAEYVWEPVVKSYVDDYLSKFVSGGNFIIDLTEIGCSLYDKEYGDSVLEKIRSGMIPIIYDGYKYAPAVYMTVSSACGGSLNIGYYSTGCGSPYVTSLNLFINYS